MIQKIRESKQIVIVVLDGIKLSADSTGAGIEPLCRVMYYAVNPNDEVLVLTLHSVREPSSDIHQSNYSCKVDPYIRLLCEETDQRKEIYTKIFKPFYLGCKRNGVKCYHLVAKVKFQVKVAAGFWLKDILIQEANNVKATWIIMDSCFARHLSFRLNGTDCDVSIVSDQETATFNNYLLANDESESTFVNNIADNPKSPKQMKESISIKPSPGFNDEYQASSRHTYPPTSTEDQIMFVKMKTPPTKEAISHDIISVQPKELDTISQVRDKILLGQPMQLSWECIMQLTNGFTRELKSSILGVQNNKYVSYYGSLEANQNLVLVKRCRKDSGAAVLEAEKKAALYLHHKNILSLIGYHRSENDTILVFPLLYDLRRKQSDFTFEEKLKVAIGIAQGIRYMHEECPRGPVVHGGLHARNIFLTPSLQPKISGFEDASWLHVEDVLPVSNNRFHLYNALDHESMAVVKSDIFSFGILLLRLFCSRSVVQDDKTLIEWARPLLLQGAFHLLSDESEDLDVHAIYRVMTVATLCTKTKPMSRPSMCEVIAILKGEDFCTRQSPLTDDST